ncbi:hypothetical protein KKI24_05945 [bacterium]|nr:hypothetical protein [bacterium]
MADTQTAEGSCPCGAVHLVASAMSRESAIRGRHHSHSVQSHTDPESFFKTHAEQLT